MIDRCLRFLPLMLASFFFMAPAMAAEPLAPLLACRALADTTARLDCFDRESAKLAGAPARTASAPSPSMPAPAPAAAPAAPPAAVPSPQETFGLSQIVVDQKEVAAGKRPAELKQIEAHLVSVSSTGTGVATFMLDNGQVWREVTPAGDLLAKPGDKLTISRGLLSSFWLQAKNGRGSKVTRVQ
jgi:hypothetical protein